MINSYNSIEQNWIRYSYRKPIIHYFGFLYDISIDNYEIHYMHDVNGVYGYRFYKNKRFQAPLRNFHVPGNGCYKTLLGRINF